MKAIDELRLDGAQEEPRVWISRLAIYPSWSPDAIPIRDVELRRGVNFVWAEEPRRGTSQSGVSGHSAGKTTFCRFVRYVLGESVFSTKSNTVLISAAFPDGYVAAEVNVRGRRWAVRRPLGTGRLSYVLPDATLGDLLAQGGDKVSKEEYLSRLGFEEVLEQLPTRTVPREPRQLGWGHVLAWCARDQEARYQSVHDWRSPRSESDSPEFKYSRLGPLFAMRAVLGILPPNEIGIEREIARLEDEIDAVRDQVAEARREPAYWTSHYEKSLIDWAQKNEQVAWSEPQGDGGLFSDSNLRVDAAEGDVKTGLARLLAESEELQADLVDVALDLRQLELARQNHEKAARLSQMSAEALRDPRNRVLLEEWEEFKTVKCRYGRVLYGECVHIDDRRTLIKPEEVLDARRRDKAEADHRAVADEERREVEIIDAQAREFQDKRSSLEARHTDLKHEIRAKQRALDDLVRIRAGLDEWVHRKANAAHERATDLQRGLSDLERDLHLSEDKLVLSASEADENLEKLRQIYSAAVRGVASGADGRVETIGRELRFQIIRGSALGGEAMGSLSILVADLAALIHGCVAPSSSHPSFLLHDSPREADMSLNLYEEYLLAAVAFEEAFGGWRSCPFQYIVTTTTPPPDDATADGRLRLQLNAADPSGLLLQRVVAAPLDSLLEGGDGYV